MLMPLSFFLTSRIYRMTPLVFGWIFPNVHLLTDNYAKAGFYAYVPDTHEDDSLPIEFLQNVEPPLPVRESLSVVQKTAKTAKVGATLECGKRRQVRWRHSPGAPVSLYWMYWEA